MDREIAEFDPFDEDPAELEVLDTIYDLTTLQKIQKITRAHPETSFWLYHSAGCRPPRSMTWGQEHHRHNVTLRPNPNVKDGRLVLLDHPMPYSGWEDHPSNFDPEEQS